MPLSKIPAPIMDNLALSDFKCMMKKKSDSFKQKILTDMNNEKRQRIELIAKKKASEEMYSIKKCPVCGIDSLIVFHYNEIDDSTNQSYQRNNEVECAGCSFNICETDIKNASVYGFSNIDDYWL